MRLDRNATGQSDEMTIRERFMAALKAEGATSPGSVSLDTSMLLESMTVGFDAHKAMQVEL